MHFETTLSSQNQPHSIALHVEFVRRTQTGHAFFTVEDVKLGRQTSIINITLIQGDLEEVVGYITNSNMVSESGATFLSGYKLLPPPLPVDLALLSLDKDSNWARQLNMPFASFRKATQKIQFHYPREGQSRRGTADEWIRLASGEKWTDSSLGFVADAFPMPVEAFLHNSDPYSIGNRTGPSSTAKYWYPTLLLNLDFKKHLPDAGLEWLFLRAITKQIKNGRMDIDIMILDEDGEIVALSHHIALVLDAKRNLAERKAGSKI